MKNEIESWATYLFLVELCCFHVQPLEESVDAHTLRQPNQELQFFGCTAPHVAPDSRNQLHQSNQ